MNQSTIYLQSIYNQSVDDNGQSFFTYYQKGYVMVVSVRVPLPKPMGQRLLFEKNAVFPTRGIYADKASKIEI